MKTDNRPVIVKPVSLSEQAYEIIKEEIITNRIKAGEILTEEQLASRLNISRTPIRTALKQLVLEHLAEVNENKNVVVSNITAEDVKNVCAVRKALEPLAVELITDPAVEKKTKELRKTIKAQKAAKTHEEFLSEEYNFHMGIASLAKNSFLYDMIDKTNIMIKRYLILSGTLDKHSDEALSEHEAILDCLEKKDFPAARDALKLHLSNVEERMFL